MNLYTYRQVSYECTAQGVMSQHDVHAELGEVVNGSKPGRETETEIIVCDLTGTGAQDAAIGGVAWNLLSGA